MARKSVGWIRVGISATLQPWSQSNWTRLGADST